MGRIIAKRLKGMNWMAKISLMLIFTFLLSIFMYQGWYKPKNVQAVDTVIFLTSGASWVVPADWSSTNTIEVIGGGGGGDSATNTGSGGGGGGAYAKIINLSLTPSGSVTIQVGAFGAQDADGTDTWFNGATCAGASVCATAGLQGLNASGGAGGLASGGVGTTKYDGGIGGNGNNTGDTGGGGGSAAGPGGAGENGGAGEIGTASGGGGGAGGTSSTVGGNASGGIGGNGGNGPAGTGGATGTANAGASGTAGTGGGGAGAGGTIVTPGGGGAQYNLWTQTSPVATAGPGGGGGGAGNGGVGGGGGGYGAGGGGGEGTGGSGTQGIIVITYTPVAGDTVNVADGTDPANYTVYPSDTNKVADSFTMATNANTAVVTAVTASLTNSGNISGIRLYLDAGTIGTYDSGIDTLLSTGTPGASVTFSGLSQTLTTTATNYLIVADISSGAIPTQQVDTSVTGITVTAPDTQGTISDASNPTRLTIGSGNLAVANGTNPANANAPKSSTNNALDGFTLAMSVGSGTVSTLTVTGSAFFTSTNIPTNGVKIYRDAGTIGVYDSGVDTLISSGSTAISGNATTVTLASAETVTTSAANYLVTVDINAGATLTQTFTGTVTAATGSGLGTPTYNDSGSATLTVTAAQTLTFGDGTNPVNANAPQGSTNKALDGFTLSLNSGSGTVSTLTVTGSANFNSTNIPTNGVKIYRDAGTLGVYDSGVDTLISSGSTAIAGNVTTVTLAAAETVTTSAANYLVTVDINAGATLTQTFTGTISAATGSGIGTPVDSDTASATLTITGPSQPSTITSCAGCHQYSPTFADGTARNTPVGQFLGSHNQHVVTYSYVCSACHVVPAGETSTDYKHRNSNIQMDSGKVTYTKGASWPQTNSPAFTPCTTTACHGDSSNTSADAGNWGTSLSGSDACTVCHGTKQTATADGAAAEIKRAPGGEATGFDTGKIGTPFTRNVSGDTEIGAHDGHLRGVALISNAIACTECHAVPAVTVAGIKGHLNGTPADMTFGTLATKNNTIVPAFNPSTHTCSTVYCHNETYFSTAQHTNAGTGWSPVWNNITYFGDNAPPLTATECGRCHFYDGSDCSGCHTHVNADDLSFGNPALHIDGLVQASGGDCVGCHTSIQGTRRAIKTEFGLAFGHHDASVTNADCVVCHMEGTSVADPTRSVLHQGTPGGIINLRDPDSGAVIPSVAAIFARNVSLNTLEAFAVSIQNNLCLKCHDLNGANYLGAGQTGTDGLHTPHNPFVTAKDPVNVDAHFTATNPSYHPVKGVQNNAFCDVDTMEIPWNVPNGTHKLITCFDCHAKDGATGNQASTIVAHGTSESDTLRAASTVGAKGIANPLCVACHKTTIYWGACVHSGAGSGWSGNTEARHQPGDHWGCTSCHGDDNYATAGATTQATRAVAAHGFNTANEYSFLRGASGSTWLWDATNPRTTCDNMNCGTGRSDSGFTYTPGGTY